MGCKSVCYAIIAREFNVLITRRRCVIVINKLTAGAGKMSHVAVDSTKYNEREVDSIGLIFQLLKVPRLLLEEQILLKELFIFFLPRIQAQFYNNWIR